MAKCGREAFIPPRVDENRQTAWFDRGMLKSLSLLLGVGLVGCASESGTAFTDCKLGELTGTWRVRYTEVDGTCGPLADETAVFSPGKQEPAAATCTFQTNTTSADKCRADLDWTCPTSRNMGTQRWVGVLRHTSESGLTASFTVQITDPRVTCRSTYSMTVTRL